MKKSNFTGWKEVFRFEFQQATKRKSYIVFLVLFCAVALFAQPVARLMNDKDKKVEPAEIETLYIYDETGLPISFDTFDGGEEFVNTKIELVDKAFADDYAAKIEEAAKEKSEIHKTDVCGYITYVAEQSAFKINFYKPDKTDYSEKECNNLLDAFVAFYSEAKMTAIDVSEEQMAAISAPVDSKVVFADLNGKEIEKKDDEEGISMSGYMVMIAGIMIITMLVSTCGTQIANSVVTEKSTKVIEYMMTNIRPMALITGKMLSVLLTTVIQFVAAGICYVISMIGTGIIFGETAETAAKAMETAQDSASVSGMMDTLSNINPLVIIAIIVLWLFGILFYCMIGGLCGAAASKIEELAESLKIFTLLMMLGSYGGIVVCIMMLSGKAGVMLPVTCIFPITAPFVAPPALIMGEISIVYPLIGLVLLVLVTAVMFSFTSKVFEALIYYNGKTLKVKDILAIAKTKKAAKEGK